jgi:hypothetical protein
MKEMMLWLNELRVAKTVLATVLVARQDLHYGISRMFEIHYEIHDPGHMIFIVLNDAALHLAIHAITRTDIKYCFGQ